MEAIKSNIAIIGGGLTGLTLAYLLRDTGLKVVVIEARERFGGRIHTLRKKGLPPQEMGATWLGKKHEALLSLLHELEVEIFEQIFGERAIYEPISTSPPQLVQLPPNDDPSFRIKGGTGTLIDALLERIDKAALYSQQKVESIIKSNKKLILKTNEVRFNADLVVSTLPPNLFFTSIKTDPALPNELNGLMSQTHTWMGESIKVALVFESPFWRSEKLSGTIFSSVGPIPEMYDHTNFEDDQFALVGFLNGSYFSLSKEERLQMILRQLRKYYGNKIDGFIAYEEAVWRNEPLTFSSYSSHVLPHQNNGHMVFQQPYLNGQLFIAGAETAPQHPGYMEGAVRSALHVAAKIKSLLAGV
ncbi:MAG: NAD(P)/FAD-dependent oxidoreductase [Bacteroidota bacterium]